VCLSVSPAQIFSFQCPSPPGRMVLLSPSRSTLLTQKGPASKSFFSYFETRYSQSLEEEVLILTFLPRRPPCRSPASVREILRSLSFVKVLCATWSKYFFSPCSRVFAPCFPSVRLFQNVPSLDLTTGLFQFTSGSSLFQVANGVASPPNA